MTFLPEVCGHILKKKAMDSRESLHVASLGNANFSATMSNVDEPKGGMLRDAWLRYKPGWAILDSSASYRKDVIPLGY